jgi:competence ComEA-like helix-hairpin-helix protein
MASPSHFDEPASSTQQTLPDHDRVPTSDRETSPKSNPETLPISEPSTAGIVFKLTMSIVLLVASLFWWYANPSAAERFSNRTDSNTDTGAGINDNASAIFLININTADAATLQLLPNIGPTLSANIINYREQQGGFKSIDELEAVKKIGPKTLARMRRFVCLK